MEVDISGLPLEVRQKMDEIVRKDFDLKLLKAMEEQRRIAAFNHAHQPHAVEGLGEVTMRMHPFLDGMYAQYFGRNYREDQDLMRYILRHSPEFKVKSTGSRIQVGYGTGLSGAGKRVKSWS